MTLCHYEITTSCSSNIKKNPTIEMCSSIQLTYFFVEAAALDFGNEQMFRNIFYLKLLAPIDESVF